MSYVTLKSVFVLLNLILFLSLPGCARNLSDTDNSDPGFEDEVVVPDVTVPDVRGLSQNTAVRVLEEEGLKVNPSVQHVNDDTI